MATTLTVIVYVTAFLVALVLAVGAIIFFLWKQAAPKYFADLCTDLRRQQEYKKERRKLYEEIKDGHPFAFAHLRRCISEKNAQILVDFGGRMDFKGDIEYKGYEIRDYAQGDSLLRSRLESCGFIHYVSGKQYAFTAELKEFLRKDKDLL